jgi:hypothetical protein
MTDQSTPHEYLVVSRGQWDKQVAIDQFYAWYDRNVEAGRMQTGHRLSTEGRVVSKAGVTDGPFVETKEVIGGIWFIVADSLEGAAALAAENPCIACGLSFEIRPIEPKRASAYVPSNETPTG